VNLRGNPHAKFVLVNYASKDHLDEYIRLNHMADIESGRLVVYRFTEPTPFRMSHAKNLAHRLGILEGADVLVNLDADNYAGDGADEWLAGTFNGARKFAWARMVKDGTMDRGISGRIAVTPEAFLLAGGYDEKYEHWASDDKDFHVRLCKLGYFGEEIPREHLRAVRHNDKVRFAEYPHIKPELLTGEDFCQVGENPVVNAGRIGCGVVYRNWDREPIEISPVPARIFGIGMHKTATTSLNRALQLLGYRSGHWENAHWARAIYDEMAQYGRSATLERYYAVSDLPIPLLFRELDTAYPGSKFVLTARDDQEWLASVRNHWSHNNPHRAAWSTDPFTHRVHKLLYGQKGFDAELFLRRYRRHNAEVREYFAGRPRDLLVMDMSKGAGWYEICGFLRRAIPDEPYPHQLRALTFEAGAGI